jgi:transposase
MARAKARWWYEKDEIFLRERFGRASLEEIAAALGRTAQSVYGKVRQLRLQKKRSDPKAWEARLRRLHAQGESDSEIARRLELPQSTVSRWRKRMGLEANGVYSGKGVMRRQDAERNRKALARKALAMGAHSWMEHMRARKRLRHLLAFSGCVSRSEVLVCQTLQKAGCALTVREISALSGVKEHSARYALRSLVGFGMVVCEGTYGRRYALAERRTGRPVGPRVAFASPVAEAEAG